MRRSNRPRGSHTATGNEKTTMSRRPTRETDTHRSQVTVKGPLPSFDGATVAADAASPASADMPQSADTPESADAPESASVVEKSARFPRGSRGRSPGGDTTSDALHGVVDACRERPVRQGAG